MTRLFLPLWLTAIALIALWLSVAEAHEDHYSAEMLTCWDGDTCRAHIDLGLGASLRDQPIRLYGIDTPELRGPEREAGIVSRDWLRAQIAGQTVLLETHGHGKYGRLLATIWLGGRNINAELIERGLAREYLP